ncbi:putative sexual development protein [Xylogone sp. PMI_703]|nr:putative sexual development protein [Xylogone sp. PMI_703]
MHGLLPIASAALFTAAAAVPFSFPLSNGFPNPNDAELNQIELAAQGSLPNGPPPDQVTPDTLTSLRLINFAELTEVAFFTELIYNITNNLPGYRRSDIPKAAGSRSSVIENLLAVQAQEELHVLNAKNALVHFGQEPIQPCQYQFPVTNFKDAIALASTFTDVVLGTLPDVQNALAVDGDIGLIRGIGSVIAQEGEQNGWYRLIEGKIPSALPFLTAGAREYAFSAQNQNFVVPGSCPNSNTIDLPIFKPLTIITHEIDAKPEELLFKIAPDSSIDLNDYSIAFINQQNTPVIADITNIDPRHDETRFQAWFPYNGTTFGNGLTIAALVKGKGPLADVDAVAKATYAGPGLIEIN